MWQLQEWSAVISTSEKTLFTTKNCDYKLRAVQWFPFTLLAVLNSLGIDCAGSIACWWQDYVNHIDNDAYILLHSTSLLLESCE